MGDVHREIALRWMNSGAVDWIDQQEIAVVAAPSLAGPVLGQDGDAGKPLSSRQYSRPSASETGDRSLGSSL
jgi:hypothetical protein